MRTQLHVALLWLFLPIVILIKRIGHENKCGTIIIFYNSNISYSLICPNKDHLRSLSTSFWWPWPQSKIKTIGHAIICHLPLISGSFNINHYLTCPKTLEKRPNGSKYWIMIILHNFVLLPDNNENETKTIGHAINCDILIVWCHPNISHTLTCPKPVGNVLFPVTRKIITMYSFCFVIFYQFLSTLCSYNSI